MIMCMMCIDWCAVILPVQSCDEAVDLGLEEDSYIFITPLMYTFEVSCNVTTREASVSKYIHSIGLNTKLNIMPELNTSKGESVVDSSSQVW